MTVGEKAREAALVGKKCCKRVMGDFRFYLCNKPAKVIEDGKPFCGRHDPEKDRKRMAERVKKWEQDKQRWEAEAARAAEDARRLLRYNRAIDLLLDLKDETEAEIPFDEHESSNAIYVCRKVSEFLAEEPKQ